jgi:hypothetical protein
MIVMAIKLIDVLHRKSGNDASKLLEQKCTLPNSRWRIGACGAIVS